MREKCNEDSVMVKGVVGQIGDRMVQDGDIMVQGGSGLIAPLGETVPIMIYASVASGGNSSTLSATRDGICQQRLLGALKRGERSVVVDGREVDLSFWREAWFRSLPRGHGEGGGGRLVRLRQPS